MPITHVTTLYYLQVWFYFVPCATVISQTKHIGLAILFSSGSLEGSIHGQLVFPCKSKSPVRQETTNSHEMLFTVTHNIIGNKNYVYILIASYKLQNDVGYKTSLLIVPASSACIVTVTHIF